MKGAGIVPVWVGDQYCSAKKREAGCGQWRRREKRKIEGGKRDPSCRLVANEESARNGVDRTVYKRGTKGCGVTPKEEKRGN